jgi:hypothetical protein
VESLRSAVDLARLVHEVGEGLIVERHGPRSILISWGGPPLEIRAIDDCGLSVFKVHPWTVLTFYEPVPQMIEWL